MTERIWVPPQSLEDIWREQADFNSNFVHYEQLVDDASREQWLQRYIMLLQREVSELLEHTNFKHHYLRRKPLDYARLHEELVDIFKYWASCAQVLGLDVPGFFAAYHQKSTVVRDRWEREKLKLRTQSKVAVFDLDGVLNVWPITWVSYLNQNLGTSFDYRQMHSFYVSECFNITRDKEEDLKATFLQDGIRHTPMMHNADFVLKHLRGAGYTVAVVTGRPQGAQSYYDVVSWLHQHNVPYDLLIWGEEKKDTIMDELAPAVPAFVVEDKPATVIRLASKQYPVFVPDWPYNRGSVPEEPGRIERIQSLADVLVKVGLA